jgi:putative redox protein
MPGVVARRREGYTHDLEIREHRLTIDEPVDRGGNDQGPTPTELLAGSLAACTAVTIEMYADRKGWDLGRVEVSVDYGRPSDGSLTYETKISTPADLSDDQRERILVIASKCPVHKALTALDVRIEDSLSTIEA